MAELFISATQGGLEIYPNPELKPESGWSAELGLKQGIKIGNMGDMYKYENNWFSGSYVKLVRFI